MQNPAETEVANRRIYIGRMLLDELFDVQPLRPFVDGVEQSPDASASAFAPKCRSLMKPALGAASTP
jgi:hypothetical protein